MEVISTSLSDRIEGAVAALDFEKISREYWEQDEFVFIPHCLSTSALSSLIDDVERLTPKINRNYIPFHKKGGSVSYFSICGEGPNLLGIYRSTALCQFLSRLVRTELKLCPADDPHACALYFYTEAGDHIGYHYDTSYYQGVRYTVLIGLVDESSSRLLCHLYTRQSGRAVQELSITTTPGSMVIFNGDKVYHAVSPLQAGERRIVLTLEYVTHQQMGRMKRIFSNLKDSFAYFGLSALWQSWKSGK